MCMHMCTCSHHTMVTKTIQILSLFPFNMFLYWSANLIISAKPFLLATIYQAGEKKSTNLEVYFFYNTSLY